MTANGMYSLRIDQPCMLETDQRKPILACGRIVELSDMGGRIQSESQEAITEAVVACLLTISEHQLKRFNVCLTPDEQANSLLFSLV